MDPHSPPQASYLNAELNLSDYLAHEDPPLNIWPVEDPHHTVSPPGGSYFNLKYVC